MIVSYRKLQGSKLKRIRSYFTLVFKDVVGALGRVSSPFLSGPLWILPLAK